MIRSLRSSWRNRKRRHRIERREQFVGASLMPELAELRRKGPDPDSQSCWLEDSSQDGGSVSLACRLIIIRLFTTLEG